MERRIAIKNMAAALGYSIALPTISSILQSCKEQAKSLEWVPEFLDVEMAKPFMVYLDTLLPATETPSATEVRVHIFLDKFLKEILDEKQQRVFYESFKGYLNHVKKESGKSANMLASADFEPSLVKVFKGGKKDLKSYYEIMDEYLDQKGDTPTMNLSEDAASFVFNDKIRGLAIMAYTSSEYVGEKVLTYLPVPGEYIACGNLNELTRGLAWSG